MPRPRLSSRETDKDVKRGSGQKRNRQHLEDLQQSGLPSFLAVRRVPTLPLRHERDEAAAEAGSN